MKNDDLIISLIQQDLKHNQLVIGLENLGLESEGLFNLDVSEIVCKLMKVPGGQTEERWFSMYISFMNEAPNYEVTSRNESLRPIAELCYRQLKALLEYENKS